MIEEVQSLEGAGVSAESVIARFLRRYFWAETSLDPAAFEVFVIDVEAFLFLTPVLSFLSLAFLIKSFMTASVALRRRRC